MFTRRETLATTGGLASALLAGCTGLIFGDGTEFEASTASVSQAALEETGYEDTGTQNRSLERTFEAAGQSRTVSVVNWQHRYEKTIDLSMVGMGEQRAGTFSAVTSPQVEVAGQDLNPLGEMSPSDILQRAQGNLQGIEDVGKVGSTDATMLGETVTVSEFRGSARLSNSGGEVDVVLFVTEAVETGEDFALAVGGYPEALDSQERSNVMAMIEGVQHGD